MEKKHPQPIQITDHLFQLGLPCFATYLSLGEDGMLIDGGTSPTADIILHQVEALGIAPERIKYLIPTHTHGDHIGAIPRLRSRWPHLKILAGPVAAKFLGGERLVKEFLPLNHMIGKICLDRGFITDLPEDPGDYDFHADGIVADGACISLGDGIEWQIHETPGHSPCHISLFENKEKTLMMGDMTGYHDPELDVIWPNYFFSIEEYIKSIWKVMPLNARHGLLSHNGLIKGDVSTYLEKALRATETYHLDLLERLSRGEEPENIAAEKADWVVSLGPLASHKMIVMLCTILLKHSKKWEAEPVFFSPAAAA